MTSIFNYNSLKVSLSRKTRNVHLELLFSEFCLESLFELETFFGWVSNHVEINSVTVSSNNEIFPSRITEFELERFDQDKLSETMKRFQKLTLSMHFLPQTIIFDLGKGASGLGLEFALGADIRVAKNKAQFKFNQLEEGLIPSAGGIGLLSLLFGHSNASNWNLSPLPLSANQLLGSGFIMSTYEELFNRQEFCHLLARQSQMCRMQSKRALLVPLLEIAEKIIQEEAPVVLAGIGVEDWKRYLHAKSCQQEPIFMSPIDFARECSKERSYQSPAT